MEIFNAIILGIVQGITEFLPISSSGHLILARSLLGEKTIYALSFDAVLQLATTLAILFYFRKKISSLIKSFFLLLAGKLKNIAEKTLIFAIIIGTIPAAFFGVILERQMQTNFRSPWVVVSTLLLGSLLMFLAERHYKKSTNKNNISTLKGFWVGVFQALALLPGMSRSGMTISGGLFNSIKREEAIKFSFLLALPILFGSGLKKLFDLNSEGVLGSIGVELFIGSIVSFFVGLLAIHFLITYLKKHTLKVFVWYRIVLAIILIAILV